MGSHVKNLLFFLPTQLTCPCLLSVLVTDAAFIDAMTDFEYENH